MVHDVVADVILHDRGAESMNGAAEGGDEHENVRAADFCFGRALDRFGLAFDPARAVDEFLRRTGEPMPRPGVKRYGVRLFSSHDERSGLMRFTLYLSGALLAASAFGGAASAANMCRAERLTCPTTMPVGGYCECTAHGATEGGTVETKLAPRTPVNATAGGCGAHPGAPGCR